jgi:hypothetical protein
VWTRKKQEWKERIGLYVMAILLFYFSLAGLASVGMQSMIRYLFPVHVMLVLLLARYLTRHPPSEKWRSVLLIAVPLLLACSFSIELLFAGGFVHGNWVA